MSVRNLYPQQRPTLNLNFAQSKILDPRITFTRTSTATYVDEDGFIKTADSDVARFDHDPVTGECFGLLVEELRSNLIAYSKEHSQWITNGNVTVISNDTISPDGTLSADKIIGVSEVFDGKGYNVSGMIGNKTYTVVSFIKSDNQTQTRIGVFSSVDGWYGFLDTNWNSSGDPTTQTSSGASNITYDEYPNKWYRVSFQFTTPSTINGTISYYHMPDRTDTQKYAWFWGAQLEQGSFPTSYIPTEGSTKTRNPDNVSMTGTNFIEWYNPTESTFFVSFRQTYDASATVPPSTKHVLQAGNDTTVNDNYTIRAGQTSTTWTALIRSASPSSLQFPGLGGFGYLNSSTLYKAALSVNSSLISVSLNGLLNADTTNTTTVNHSTTFNKLFIGSGTGGLPPYELSGHISKLTYYPVRLTNTQLQNLTK